MKRSTWLAATAALLFLCAAQADVSADGLWADVDPARLAATGERTVEPTRYRALSLDLPAMVDRLAAARSQGASTEGADSELLVSLPHPDGRFVDFRVWRSGLLSPGLAKRYPQLRTYRGVAVDGSGERVWLDVTTKGFHAMVRGSEGSWFIDPYWRSRTDEYVSYWRADLPRPEELPDLQPPIGEPLSAETMQRADGLQARGDELRTYRLAMAATGEYTQFHGGAVSDGLSAIVTTMNRVSGIYEDELSVTFTLIANTDDVIYTDGGTDPYTNNSGGTMLGENQANLDNVIGTANYDIGHVFSTGGGGIASLGSVCSGNFKARGVTGLGSPVGDPFDVDYVSHEIGHQFGGNHTFNDCGGNAGPIPYEPFSGSTIMAYAGICPDNIQNNSDAHFHTGNFDEMSSFVGAGGGSNCGSLTTLDNDPPSVEAGAGGMTIPARTPFVLTGSATDPDSDTLRYRWEQHDTVSDNGPPLFRSFPATSEPLRVFPRLSDLLNNTQDIGESLPTGSRTMSFRLTALDDNATGGGVDYDEIVFDVDGGSGPFLVTAPNTAVTWATGATETVTWDVAGTDSAPVSCATVDIDLSSDGGQTFDVNVATNASNDGSETITVPAVVTTEARLRVRCSDNIFFDLSNENFTIEAGSDDFTVAVSPSSLQACVGDTAVLDVAVGQIGSFAEVVSLSASGHGGSTVFSQNDEFPPFESELQLGSLTEGNFTVTVTGTATSASKQDTADLAVIDSPSAAPGLVTPADGTTLGDVAPTLEWTAVLGGTDYLVEIDDQPDFASPVLAQTVAGTSLDVPQGLLQGGTLYYWRVTAQNSCGEQASVTRQFTTASISCQTYASSDVPVAIGTSPVTVTSDLAIGNGGEIVDVNVVDLDIAHSYVSDLTISLTSPASTAVVLMDQPCDNQNNIFMSFDDEAAAGAGTWPCPPTDGGSYQPENSLTAFDGEASDGTWQLTVVDAFTQDGGSIDGWSLQVCTSQEEIVPLIFQDRFEQ